MEENKYANVCVMRERKCREVVIIITFFRVDRREEICEGVCHERKKVRRSSYYYYYYTRL